MDSIKTNLYIYINIQIYYIYTNLYIIIPTLYLGPMMYILAKRVPLPPYTSVFFPVEI